MDVVEEKFSLHCAWIRQHPNYACPATGRKGEEYIELLKELYNVFRRSYQKYGHTRLLDMYLKDDIKRQAKQDAISIKLQEIEKNVMTDVVNDESRLWAFITVGFNEQTITPVKMANVSKKIANLKYFKECYYVLEKHRSNGIHHHTHFLVKLCKKEYPTKLIGWIFGVAGMKDVCLKKEFIDVLGPINSKKVYQPFDTYYNYIRGIKKEEKMPFVEMDRKWRDENKIDDLLKND